MQQHGWAGMGCSSRHVNFPLLDILWLAYPAGVSPCQLHVNNQPTSINQPRLDRWIRMTPAMLPTIRARVAMVTAAIHARRTVTRLRVSFVSSLYEATVAYCQSPASCGLPRPQPRRTLSSLAISCRSIWENSLHVVRYSARRLQICISSLSVRFLLCMNCELHTAKSLQTKLIPRR